MPATPNQRLASARLAAGLTQEQLAELGNTEVETLTGHTGGMDADYISKLERGIHTWPNKHYRQALRRVLAVATDADLGFYSQRVKRATVGGAVVSPAVEGIDDVNRQAFLRALAVTVAGAAADDPIAEAIGHPASGQIPAHVGQAEVGQLNHAIEIFGGWQDLYGGGVCHDAIAGHVSVMGHTTIEC